MNTFHASRYPHLRAIVEGDADATQTLADQVRDKILRQIVRNKLPAGTPLSTIRVADMFGVSRTPAARALAELAADGILIQPQKQHAVVSADAVHWLRQCRELRELLEPPAARRAAGSVAPDVLSDLWAVSREAAPSRDYDWIPAADFFDAGVHLAIADHCGNLPLRVAIRRCWKYKQLAFQARERSRAALALEYRQHVQILKSVAKADSDAAYHTMAKHLRDARRTTGAISRLTAAEN